MNSSSMRAFTRAQWRKSSRSATGNEACVEVADLNAAVGVRDSKDPTGPALAVTREAWRTLASRISAGDLDL